MSNGVAQLAARSFSDTLAKAVLTRSSEAIIAADRGISAAGGAVAAEMRNSLAGQVHASRDEIDVSIANLTKLALVYSSRFGSADPAHITPFGREFLRAVRD